MAWQLYVVDSRLFSEECRSLQCTFSLLLLVISPEPVSVGGVRLVAQPVSGAGQTLTLQGSALRSCRRSCLLVLGQERVDCGVIS